MQNIQKNDHPKHNTSLQRSILSITLIFTIFIGAILSFLSTYFYNIYIKRGLLQSTDANLSFMVDSINGNIKDITRLIYFCQTHSYITDFMNCDNTSSSQLALKAHARLSEELISNDSYTYVHRCIVGNSYDRYIQIVDATSSTSKNVGLITRNLDIYEQQISMTALNFTNGFTDDPYLDKKSKSVLTLIRPIEHNNYSEKNGYVSISLKEDFFTAPLKYYSMPDDSSIYLTLGKHVYLMENNTLTEIDISSIKLNNLNEIGLSDDTIAYSYHNSLDNSTGMLITKPLSVNGCYISQLISNKEMNSYIPYYIIIIIVITSLIILIGFLLSMILYQVINVPVMKIQNRLKDISRGDFNRDTSIEWKHELGDIGKGINDLSENIEELLNTKIQDEKDKKDLEYKMLQSQINPHFLYNTLNSIKWMAVTQGADGISEMTTALSRLLRSISKGTQDLVSLSNELDLVNDYFTIQQYRYGGTLKMNTIVDEPELYTCLINKFTLQPLVENAIFHGIEPKQTTGTITIHIYRENDKDICVSVEDDGVGMTQEKIDQILSENCNEKSQFFKEIGIINIHKRIQYEFGREYGIFIESEPNKFTRMTVRIPARNSDPNN